MKRALAFASIPALFLAGAGVAHALLASSPQRIAIDRAQPLVVVTAWGTYGAQAFAILAATIACAAIALVVAFLKTPGEPGDDFPLLLSIVTLALIACAAWPFVFSSDLYAYAAYGDLANRGLDPYRLVAPNVHDALIDAARWQWGGRFPPCVYGPWFVALARGPVALAHFARADARATLWLFRIGAALAFLASIACARVALAPVAAQRRGAILAAYALNPVVLWSVAEGHNDVYAMLAVAAISALASRLGRFGTLAALPLAAVIKASAAVLSIAIALDAVLVERRPRRPIALALGAGFGLALALSVPPLMPALRAIARTRHEAPPGISLTGVGGTWTAAAAALAFSGIALCALRNGRRVGHAWLGLAVVAALPSDYPWYALWLAPLALAEARTRAAQALWVVTICAVVRYLPDAYGTMSSSTSWIAVLLVVAPIAYALTGLPGELAVPHEEPLPT